MGYQAVLLAFLIEELLEFTGPDLLPEIVLLLLTVGLEILGLLEGGAGFGLRTVEATTTVIAFIGAEIGRALIEIGVGLHLLVGRVA